MNDITVIDHKRRGELVAGSPVVGIIPTTVEDVWRIADAIIMAGAVPGSYDGGGDKMVKAKLTIAIMKGLEVGFGPMTAIGTIAIINNRPCIWGDGAVALCQRDGHVEWAETTWSGAEMQDDWTCTYTIKRRGQSKPYIATFSVAKAKRARLWNNPKKAPWMEHPERMLFNRARAFALRDGFADCLMGLSIAEEVRDMDEPPRKLDTGFLDETPALEHVAAPLPAAEEAKPPIFTITAWDGEPLHYEDPLDLPAAWRQERDAARAQSDPAVLPRFDAANLAFRQVLEFAHPDLARELRDIDAEAGQPPAKDPHHAL